MEAMLLKMQSANADERRKEREHELQMAKALGANGGCAQQ